MNHERDFLPGILVGGLGTRLGGRDKASLAGPDGRSFLRRIEGLLTSRGEPGVLLGRPGQVVRESSWSLLEDPAPGHGPMQGLANLLALDGPPWRLLVAVDLPNLSPAILDALLDARTPDVDLVVPRSRGRLHPTCALYHTRLLEPVRAALQRGDLGLHRLIQTRPHRVVTLGPEHDETLVNINEPADLAGWLSSPSEP